MDRGWLWRWTTLVATVWIQALTGTNFDFSAYSSELKAAMGISQLQLGYLATASDLGKAFGWSSGLALLYLPLPAVLFLASTFGLIAYGAQWLIITSRVSLPYLLVFFLCLVAGCSICWFNTVCFMLCIKNFPVTSSFALSLSISFNGVSAAIYTLAVHAIGSSTSSVYLLLNAVLPFIVATAALFPILHQPHGADPVLHALTSRAAEQRETHAFFFFNVIAFLTGMYLLLLSSVVSSSPFNGRILLTGTCTLLLFPLCIPVLLRPPNERRSGINIEVAGEDGFNQPLSERQTAEGGNEDEKNLVGEEGALWTSWWWCWWFDGLMEKDRIVILGEEHSIGRLLKRIDFWLYYVGYFCGATLGLVYNNNLGQIAQSLGKESETTTLVTIYSACSFFGRLASSIPDYISEKVSFARTGWISMALAPMPLAFFLLAEVEEGRALVAGLRF